MLVGIQLSFISLPLIAVEALDTAELADHCSKYQPELESADGIFCVRYIQGFIDGAVVTDERVTLNVAAEQEREETFSERAIRTRVGDRLRLYGPSVYAGFCLGDPVPLKEVVDRVVDDLGDAEKVSANPLARDLVYRTLLANYACQVVD